jgi:alpha-beta hydrolase superfamily lysophospholipase
VITLLSTCSADTQGWQAVPVDGVAAAATGSGPATVVLLNDSGNSVCGWLPLADALVERQLKVVMFAYRSTAADNEAEAVRDTLAVADGARSGNRYALIGASLGGRVVIEAAATVRPTWPGSSVCRANAPSRTTAISCPMLGKSPVPRCTSGQRTISPPRVSGSSGGCTRRCEGKPNNNSSRPSGLQLKPTQI